MLSLVRRFARSAVPQQSRAFSIKKSTCENNHNKLIFSGSYPINNSRAIQISKSKINNNKANLTIKTHDKPEINIKLNVDKKQFVWLPWYADVLSDTGKPKSVKKLTDEDKLFLGILAGNYTITVPEDAHIEAFVHDTDVTYLSRRKTWLFINGFQYTSYGKDTDPKTKIVTDGKVEKYGDGVPLEPIEPTKKQEFKISHDYPFLQ